MKEVTGDKIIQTEILEKVYVLETGWREEKQIER